MEVRSLPGHTIWIRYEDGAEGKVDLSDLAGKGVFELWDEPGIFEQVHLGAGGAIAWSEEVELCPNAVYLRPTGEVPEEVFPALREFKRSA